MICLTESSAPSDTPHTRGPQRPRTQSGSFAWWGDGTATLRGVMTMPDRSPSEEASQTRLPTGYCSDLSWTG